MSSKTTLLYVDDEQLNTFIFKANFDTKYNVITASSAIEGLEKLDENHADINAVITDMRMPNMNGVEFVKKAKQKYGDKYYYVLSAFTYDDEIQTALNNNLIKKFFTKPFSREEIEAEMESLAS
ncbi:MAG: response regulator [Cyclobacteriaceae bacterium]